MTEADGLRAWNGDGAVRVFATDGWDDCSALLLERCRPGTPLGSCVPEPEQDLDDRPKALLRDPAYDVLQHMLNCDRLGCDPRGLARRLAELLELDPRLVVQWLRALRAGVDRRAGARAGGGRARPGRFS